MNCPSCFNPLLYEGTSATDSCPGVPMTPECFNPLLYEGTSATQRWSSTKRSNLQFQPSSLRGDFCNGHGRHAGRAGDEVSTLFSTKGLLQPGTCNMVSGQCVFQPSSLRGDFYNLGWCSPDRDGDGFQPSSLRGDFCNPPPSRASRPRRSFQPSSLRGDFCNDARVLAERHAREVSTLFSTR